MTTLEKLRALANARTKGPWAASMFDGIFGVATPRAIQKITCDYEDALFIAAAANSFDRLLDLWEAAKAKPIADHWNEEYCNRKEFAELQTAEEKFDDALAALERDGE